MTRQKTAGRVAKTRGDSAPPTVVDALAELEPFSKALASVATREEPERPDAPPEQIAAAYVVRAAWLALHRGDQPALHKMAKRARLYLDGTETSGVETTVCKMFPLPSIKGGNRADRVRELLAFAEMALKRRRDADGEPIHLSVVTTAEIARWTDFAIGRTFPELRPSWNGDESEKIAAAIGDDFKTPRELMTRALRALGVSDGKIKSWLKSAEQRP